MELLPDGQKNTAAEVLWEDQQRINKFSTLIFKKDEKLEALRKLKVEKEYLDDLGMEIELLDEDDKIQYKLGEVFVFMKVDDAVKKIEAEDEKLTAKISEIDDEIDELDITLADLKKHLYAKFGDNINLEH